MLLQGHTIGIWKAVPLVLRSRWGSTGDVRAADQRRRPRLAGLKIGVCVCVCVRANVVVADCNLLQYSTVYVPQVTRLGGAKRRPALHVTLPAHDLGVFWGIGRVAFHHPVNIPPARRAAGTKMTRSRHCLISDRPAALHL